MALRVDPRLAWQLVGDEVVILDVASGKARGLNPVASFIWARLEKENPEGICAALQREFEVDEATARRDVDAFVEELRTLGLLHELP